MKRIIILVVALISLFTTQAQTVVQDSTSQFQLPLSTGSFVFDKETARIWQITQKATPTGTLATTTKREVTSKYALVDSVLQLRNDISDSIALLPAEWRSDISDSIETINVPTFAEILEVSNNANSYGINNLAFLTFDDDVVLAGSAKIGTLSGKNIDFIQNNNVKFSLTSNGLDLGPNSLWVNGNRVFNATSTNWPSVFIGKNAGLNSTSSENVMIGLNSGLSATGGTSVGIGGNNLKTSTTNFNIAIGRGALSDAPGERNVAVGISALGNATGSTTRNVAVGYNAGIYTTTDNNVFIGYSAGSANTSGTYNTFLGGSAGQGNQTGSSNIMIGYLTGDGLETNYSNIFIGTKAGFGRVTETLIPNYNITGARTNNSIVIGDSAVVYNDSPFNEPFNNQIVIGSKAQGRGANTTVIGNSSTVKTYLYGDIVSTISTTPPSSATDTGIKGEIRITATHIYVCVDTNTWVRSELTTW